MEFIDDHPVVAHRVRFRNRVDVAETHGPLVKDDMVVVWLVRSRCEPPQYHPVTKDAEERYRLNIQAVEDAIPLAGQLRDQAIAYLDHGGTQGYLDLNVPRFRQEAMFDDDSADGQLAKLAEYLHEIGEFREDETPLDALRRLLERRLDTAPPEPAEPAEPALFNDPVPLGLGTGEIESLGSIYGDRTPASRAIIEEAFRSP